MTNETSSRWSCILLKFSSAPFILRLYCLIATLSTIFGLSALLLPSVYMREAIRGINGSLPPLGYMFGLWFIYTIIFSEDVRIDKKKLRFGIVAPLIIYAIGSFIILFAIDRSSPIVSPWLVVWTIVVPLVWVMLLLSKPVTNFLNGNSLYSKK